MFYGDKARFVEELIRTGKIDEEYLYPFNEKKYWNGGWLPRGWPRD